MGSAVGEAVTNEMRERFFARFCPEPMTGCWLWEAGTNYYGYGMLNRLTGTRRPMKAHRVAWIIHNGPIPTGKVIMHKCDTPACVNPQHLQLGTHADNVADKTAKRRHPMHNKEHCKRGHPLFGENLLRRYDGYRECRICKRHGTKLSARKMRALRKGL